MFERPTVSPRTCTYLWPWLSVTPVRGVGTCRSATQGGVDLAVQPACGRSVLPDRAGPGGLGVAEARHGLAAARIDRTNDPSWNLSPHHRRRNDPDLRRRNRPRDRGPVYQPARRTRRPARARAQARRSLYDRHARDGGRLDRRPARIGDGQRLRPGLTLVGPARRAAAGMALAQAVQLARPCAPQRRASLRPR